MIEEFTKYVNEYDLNDFRIKGKYNHSLRVMKYAEEFAKHLGLDEKDVLLAKTIGLLHDYGRFEQLRVYDTFDDLHSIDHADYSVEQLFDKGEIKKYCTDEDLYPIIRFAIKNHNKLTIPDVDDERMMLHAKIIRDADKTDIMTFLSEDLKDRPDDSEIRDEVIECIRQHKTVNRSYIKTNNDYIAVIYAFAFDLNYDFVAKYYKEKFIKFHQKMNGGRKFDEIYEEVIKYLDDRIKKSEENE